MPHPDKLPLQAAGDDHEIAPESTPWTFETIGTGGTAGGLLCDCEKLGSEPEKSVGALADLGLSCAEIASYYSVEQRCVQHLLGRRQLAQEKTKLRAFARLMRAKLFPRFR